MVANSENLHHHCMSPALEKPPGPLRQEHIANGVYCIYQDRVGLTKSIIPLFVTSGNKHPTRYPASYFPSHVFGPGDSIIFGQIECDSQNPTRSRSRSSHFLWAASPTTRLTSVLALTKVKMWGTRIGICSRSRCLDVIVRGAMTTHVTVCDSGQKIASLSFVAFKRSIGAEPASPTDEGKL